jgi:hypothetical protein
VLPEGDPGLDGIAYRVYFYVHKPTAAPTGAAARPDAVWAIRGFQPERPNSASRYLAFGPGLSRSVKTSGNTISIQGILPQALGRTTEIHVAADASARESEKPVAEVPARPVTLSGIRNPALHLSSLKPKDGPFPLAYESFHYYALPNPLDLTCTVIKSLVSRAWVTSSTFLPTIQTFALTTRKQARRVMDRSERWAAQSRESAPPSTISSHTARRADSSGSSSNPCTSAQIKCKSSRRTGRPSGLITTLRTTGANSRKYPRTARCHRTCTRCHRSGTKWDIGGGAFVSAKVGDETIDLGPVHWA